MALVLFRRPSHRSSLSLSERWLRCCRRRNLGDKLQVLAGKSPEHLKVVEVLVDLILKRLR